MTLAELDFSRPAALQATEPAELRSGSHNASRDAVRLLVSTPQGHHHSRFVDLANFLDAGDLLVVNRSATLSASLGAEGRVGPFILNLSAHYGANVWLAEPRWSYDRAGPLPLEPGERLQVAGLAATLLRPYPGLSRLWFVRFEGDMMTALERHGEPIRYGYVEKPYPLETYQTLFADTPDATIGSAEGSAEMPSAARPFSERALRSLEAKGVNLAKITLHTGVSSLEMDEGDIETQTLLAEPFEVAKEVADAVNETRARGRRVVAVGTTVVRALESAWDGHGVRAVRGFTRHYVHPGREVNAVDGLVSGFHDPKASHLAMLYAFAGRDLIREAYTEAVGAGYLWHEFGDSHLILLEKRSP